MTHTATSERASVPNESHTRAGRASLLLEEIDPKLLTERHELLAKLGGRLQRSGKSYSLLVLTLVGTISALGLWKGVWQSPQASSTIVQPAVRVATAPVQPEPVAKQEVNPRLVTATRSSQQPANQQPANQQPTVALRIIVEPKFDPALLTVWVDEQVVWRKDLTVVKKSFPIGPTPKDSQQVTITPGKHQLRVRVQAPATLYDESHTLKASLSDQAVRVLNISFGKKNEMKVALK